MEGNISQLIVVEAKIVFSKNVVLSLGTEFIENEKDDVSKQDCETNAAKRLLKKIKKIIQDSLSVFREMRFMQQNHL